MRRLMLIALRDAQHPVWDVTTTDRKEYLDHHLNLVFSSVVERVADAHGKRPAKWTWGEAHTWQPKHPFHQIPLVGAWLNSKSYAMAGSNETISQSGFTPSEEPTHIGRYGAQMRIVVDLATPETAVSVSPVGQSGHKMSAFYNDQAALYAAGQFRAQAIQVSGNASNLYLVPATNPENE
jgi:penicillin amidase